MLPFLPLRRFSMCLFNWGCISYGMDRDSIEVATIADDDPPWFAFQFRSRIPSRFEKRFEYNLSTIVSFSHRKARFHIGHHDVDFATHAK